MGGTHDVRTCATQEKKPAAPASSGAAPADGAAAAGSSAAVPVANGDSHAPEANPYAFLPDPRENYRVSSTTSYTDHQIANTETGLLCVPFTALKLQRVACSLPLWPGSADMLATAAAMQVLTTVNFSDWQAVASQQHAGEAGGAPEGHRWQGHHQISAGAQWLPAHWPCKGKPAVLPPSLCA